MFWGTLKSTVASFINRTDLTAEIPTFLNASALELQRVFNLKQIAATTTYVIQGTEDTQDGKSKVPYPVSFKALRQVWLYNGNELQHQLAVLPPGQFERAIAVSDYTQLARQLQIIVAEGITVESTDPVAITDTQDALWLKPEFSAGVVGKRLRIYYWVIVDYSIAADDFEDALLRNGWDVLLYGALTKAELFLGNDDNRDKWAPLYNKALVELQSLEGAKDYSSDTPIVA